MEADVQKKTLTKYVPVIDLILLEKNPRKISKENFNKLKKSIKNNPNYFWVRPILANNQTGKNIVYAGNQRLKGAIELKMEKVPCIIETLTFEEQKERTIRDNVELGEWDLEELSANWNTKELESWGLSLDWPEETKDGETEDDAIPDKNKTIKRCSLGDIWRLGSHRLMCGDSTKTEDVERLMGEEKADMVFTDPPYGVSIGTKNKFLKKFRKGGKGGIEKNIEGDTKTPEELKNFLVPAFQNLKKASNECCTYFVTAPQNGELGMMMMMMMKESGLPIRHILIWVKNHATFSAGRLDYEYQHEPILLTWHKKHAFYGKGSQKTSVWKFDKPMSSKLHPTMKPVELVINAIQNNSKPEDIVVDLFGGSGTTLIACEKASRKCRMMEFDEHYCDVIIQRWEDFSGLKAEKL